MKVPKMVQLYLVIGFIVQHEGETTNPLILCVEKRILLECTPLTTRTASQRQPFLEVSMSIWEQCTLANYAGNTIGHT